MKCFQSGIYDLINKCLSKIQACFKNSLIDVFDWLILFSIALTLTVSIFLSNNFTALFAFITVLLTIAKVLTTKGEQIRLEACNFFLIVYLLICFISNFTSYMPKESFLGFSKTLLYFGFYFACCQILKKRYILFILCIIAFLGGIESIIGLIQHVSGVVNISAWQDTSYVNPENILTRVYGTLKPFNPNLFGGWLIASVPSLMGISALLIYKKRLFLACISIALLLCSFLCLFYTGCRGAYIALLFIFLCTTIVLFGINKLAKIAAAALIVIGSIFLALNKSILNRLMSIFLMRGDTSTSFRINVYHSAIQMFQDNPVFGVGVGNKVFREIYGLYMISGFDALSSYCVFLEIAVESGIFALISYLLFLGISVFEGIKKFICTKDIVEKIMLFTALISILAVMVHGFTDTVYFRPQIQFVFWLMVAVITVLTRE